MAREWTDAIDRIRPLLEKIAERGAAGVDFVQLFAASKLPFVDFHRCWCLPLLTRRMRSDVAYLVSRALCTTRCSHRDRTFNSVKFRKPMMAQAPRVEAHQEEPRPRAHRFRDSQGPPLEPAEFEGISTVVADQAGRAGRGGRRPGRNSRRVLPDQGCRGRRHQVIRVGEISESGR